VHSLNYYIDVGVLNHKVTHALIVFVDVLHV